MRPVLCLLPFVLCVPLAAQDARPSAPSAARVPGPPLPLSDEAIKRAVHEVLAEDKTSAKPAPGGAVLGAERPPELRRFDVLMDDAYRPDCWHKDGLKRQPTGWGPFQIGGYAALPFIAVAALRGVCRP